MKKTLRIKLFAIVALVAFGFSFSSAQIRITEVMSSSGTGGTEDWFELTNFGTTDIDITDWKMDDNSFDYTNAVALNGITTIASGESVIFFEMTGDDFTPADSIAKFKTFWGSSLDGKKVGYYGGSGVGLSSKGDGVIIFDKEGTEVTRVSFGKATEGSSFYWTYNESGVEVKTAVVSTAGTLTGSQSNQVTVSTTGSPVNIGSPGSAVIFDTTNSLQKNSASSTWNLKGRTLEFEVLPFTAVEVYDLTGSKVATHVPASLIELDLNQGIYILKIDGRAHKVIIR
ncbi:MAG: hypothetical protein BWY08_00694 [Bacteroidetes bacterium ADurb.Bin174]|nr:MAG: hypothetical protein BWY08_00694 [Bacteroidetes bacterium ADurb.Bin174]